jgi:UPF0042 nucleotide-binding protein
MEILHATCICLEGQGILLRGPSGSGKSDLALRLIDRGALLIADDLVALAMDADGVQASLPAGRERFAGALEVRGIGILSVPHAAGARRNACLNPIRCNSTGALCEPYALIHSKPVRRPRLPQPCVTRWPMSRRKVVLITGLSGAGQSTSLKILEDLGYEALDNLPLFLLSALLNQGELMDSPLAVRIDTRTRDFSAERLISEMDSLRTNAQVDARLLFLQSDDDVLMRRFTETRRRHPLAIDRPVSDGIARERHILGPLVDAADLVLDTSDLTIHDLKRRVMGEFGLESTPELQVSVISFSYRLGLPRSSDLVFDVRFLRNPHYEPELQSQNGMDNGVAAYVSEDPEYKAFMERLSGFVLPLLPRFRSEGKSYLTIAIGCTGGQHRSVFVAEQLGKILADHAARVMIYHRDVKRMAGP